MIDPIEKITRIEDLLAASVASQENKNENNENSDTDKSIKKKSNVVEKEKAKTVIPRGKPKSGRVWKEQKQKFSSIVKSRGIRLSFDKKKQLREELKRVKQLSREAKAQKEAEKQAKKERRKENLKRTEENRKKSEIVQVIKNTAKIKRMKKKQLRSIEKRDTVNAK